MSERTTQILPLVDPLDREARKLRRGDLLNLDRDNYGTVWVNRHFHRIGRLRHGVNIDPDEWAAYVAEVDEAGHATNVRLEPFTVKDCGCVLNLGGWHVRYCGPHGVELEEAAKASVCDHDRPLLSCGRCGVEAQDLIREQETNYRSLV